MGLGNGGIGGGTGMKQKSSGQFINTALGVSGGGSRRPKFLPNAPAFFSPPGIKHDMGFGHKEVRNGGGGGGASGGGYDEKVIMSPESPTSPGGCDDDRGARHSISQRFSKTKVNALAKKAAQYANRKLSVDHTYSIISYYSGNGGENGGGGAAIPKSGGGGNGNGSIRGGDRSPTQSFVGQTGGRHAGNGGYDGQSHVTRSTASQYGEGDGELGNGKRNGTNGGYSRRASGARDPGSPTFCEGYDDGREGSLMDWKLSRSGGNSYDENKYGGGGRQVKGVDRAQICPSYYGISQREESDHEGKFENRIMEDAGHGEQQVDSLLGDAIAGCGNSNRSIKGGGGIIRPTGSSGALNLGNKSGGGSRMGYNDERMMGGERRISLDETGSIRTVANDVMKDRKQENGNYAWAAMVSVNSGRKNGGGGNTQARKTPTSISGNGKGKIGLNGNGNSGRGSGEGGGKNGGNVGGTGHQNSLHLRGAERRNPFAYIPKNSSNNKSRVASQKELDAFIQSTKVGSVRPISHTPPPPGGSPTPGGRSGKKSGRHGGGGSAYNNNNGYGGHGNSGSGVGGGNGMGGNGTMNGTGVGTGKTIVRIRSIQPGKVTGSKITIPRKDGTERQIVAREAWSQSGGNLSENLMSVRKELERKDSLTSLGKANDVSEGGNTTPGGENGDDGGNDKIDPVEKKERDRNRNMQALQQRLRELDERRQEVHRMELAIESRQPYNPLVTNLKTLRMLQRCMSKLQYELDDIRREEHMIGLRLHRAWRRRAREELGWECGFWVRQCLARQSEDDVEG